MEELNINTAIHEPAVAAVQIIKGVSDTYPPDVRVSQLEYIRAALSKEIEKTKSELVEVARPSLMSKGRWKEKVNGVLVDLRYGNDSYRYAHSAAYRKLRTELTVLMSNMRSACRKGEKGEHAAILYPDRVEMEVNLSGRTVDTTTKKKKHAPTL